MKKSRKTVETAPPVVEVINRSLYEVADRSPYDTANHQELYRGDIGEHGTIYDSRPSGIRSSLEVVDDAGRSASGPWASSLGGVDRQAAGAPLNVIHVTLAMIPAGIDRWLTGLIRYSDPRRINFLRCVVTTDLVDLKQLARVGIPVEMGGRDSVRRACQDADVLLISDPGDDPDWVQEISPGLNVFVAHGDGPWTRRRMERLAPSIDHVIAVSGRVHETVCEGFPSTLINNGVDPVHLTRSRPLREFRAGLGFRPTDFVIGFVGRFSPEKNPSAVIEAVAGLPSHFKALMVGFGPLRSDLMDLANERMPGRFVFARGEEHLGDYYGAMDAFCMVSHTEGYGLAIMEAMMCGKPPIVTEVGFVKGGITDRVNGLVVAGDPGSIREAASLLDAHREWAAGVGREAAAFADRHGHASTMSRRYAETLEALWEARRSGRRREAPSINGSSPSNPRGR